MPSATNISAASTTPPHTLTLPRNVIATLAPTAYLLAHLHPSKSSTNPATRPSGRAPTTFRPATCTTGSLANCAGSAVVRVGDTAVVCGIQSEILLAHDIADPPRGCSAGEELARLQLLVPNVELATGCSPGHLPGGPPSGEAQVLVQRVNGLLHSSGIVDVEDLKIKYTRPTSQEDEDEDENEERTETVAYWTLYASIHVMSLSGSSSLIDVAWAALVSALQDVKLPRAWWDADLERVICSDRVDETRRLQLRGLPICCTWAVFVAGKSQIGMQDADAQNDKTTGLKTLKDGSKAWLLADPDDFEDPLCRETVTLTVDASTGMTKVLRLEKSGGAVLGVQDIRDLVGSATQRWKEWADVMLPVRN